MGGKKPQQERSVDVSIIDTHGCRSCGLILKPVKRKPCDDSEGDVVMACMNPKCPENGRGRYTYRISRTARRLDPPAVKVTNL